MTQKLTDLIPVYGLYDMYQRRHSELDLIEKKYLKETNLVHKLRLSTEISPEEERAHGKDIVKRFNREMWKIKGYAAGLVFYNLAAAYGFHKFMECLYGK